MANMNSTPVGGMEGPFCLERESALGGLFQQIVNEMKNTAPYWDDFLTKSNKLHSCLRATIQAVGAFLEAFQKIADAATSTRGATKDIGTALTRICLRHKAMEAKLKSFTSSIMDCLIIPLNKRLEEWNKTTGNLDKEYGKEYKRARAELKKRTIETLRLQKKLRKGGLHNGSLSSSFHGTLPRSHGGTSMIQSALAHNGSDMSHQGLPGQGGLNRTLESSMRDQTEKRQVLEDIGKLALRAALTEERSRFCLFVSYLKPVVDEEVAMLYELQHVQEAMAQLEKNAGDPFTLPAASEQVITDIKGETGAWSFQTPPSSPSSLGSRKSSMCSISSANSSSSSSAHSPSHNVHNRTLHHQPMSIPSGNTRFSSVSSQDSGFVSQDTLYSRMSTPLHDSLTKPCNQSEGSNTSSTASSNSSTPSSPYPPGQVPPTTNSTWPNLQETIQFERAASAIMNDRPHTISSAYEKGHQRPPLTVYTFQPPADPNSHTNSPVTPTVESQSQSTPGNKIYQAASEIYGILRGKTTDSKPPVPKRGSSLERPGGSNNSSSGSTSSIPKPPRKINSAKESGHAESNKHVPYVPDFNPASDDMIVPQPVYVNMHELNQMASAKLQRQSDELPPPPPELMTPQAKSEAANNGSMNNEPTGHYGRGLSEDSHSIAPSDVTLEGQNTAHNPQMSSGSNGTLSRRNSCGQQEKPPPPRRNSSISSSARSSPVPTNSSNIYSTSQGCTMTQSQSSMNNSEYQTIQRNSNSSHPLQPIFIKNPQYSYVSSNNSVVSSQGSFDSGETTPHASMESLPPPPAYLINEHNATTILTATAEDLSKRLSVADTVRTLTEKNHQPLSPNMVRRSNSMKQPGEETRESRSQSQTNGRRGSASTLESSKQRANLMQVLNQKLAQHQTPPPYSSGYPPIPNQKPSQPIYQQAPSAHHPPTSAHHPPTSAHHPPSSAHHPPTSAYHPPNSAHHPHPPQPIYSQVYQPQPIYQQVTTGNGSAGNNASPRHPRRLSEELLKTTATFVQNRVLGSKTPPPIVTSKEIFVQTLNAKLSQMRPSPNEKKVPTMQHPQMQMQSSNGRASGYSSKHAPSKGNREEISRAVRVRKWISSKTVSDPNVCRDSLMDQIRRGTKLRTTRAMNDRSAPRIH